MGWRERDWAKFTEEEWHALYGVTRRRRSPSTGESLDLAQPVAHADRTRVVVWTAVAVAAIAVFGGVLAVRAPAEPRAAAGVATPTPLVLYGVERNGFACTAMALHRSSDEWRCLAWSTNLNGLPVVAPRQYPGPCAHAVVDQAAGAWRCLSTVPLPEDELPRS